MKTILSGSLPEHLTQNPFVASMLTFLSNVWPVGLGATLGQSVALSADWAHPWLIAVLSGAVVQLLIALLRSLFTERRDVLATLRDMLKAKDETEMVKEHEQQRVRHDLANRTYIAEMRWQMVEDGVPVEEVMRRKIRPIYDIDAEDGAEERRRRAARGLLSGEIRLTEPKG